MRFLASAIIKEIERRELLGARKATDRLLPFLLPNSVGRGITGWDEQLVRERI